MNETVRIWFEELYTKEMEEVKVTISNERVWEKGYDGKEFNPHTRNIELLSEYLERLEEKLKDIKG